MLAFITINKIVNINIINTLDVTVIWGEFQREDTMVNVCGVSPVSGEQHLGRFFITLFSDRLLKCSGTLNCESIFFKLL